MRVSGFSFLRNAVKNDYPFIEAIRSIAPLCDDLYIAVGLSVDETLNSLKNISLPNLQIIETVWDESLKENGQIFAQQTNIAFDAIPQATDWAFYIQGDECLHEKYIPVVRSAMEESLADNQVQGLLFNYLHFYGSYDFFGQSRRWYRNEIRVIRNDKAIRSYRDAQGFRIGGGKLQVKKINATIYHYGWAKPQKGITQKIKNFNQFYHDQAWMDKHIPPNFEFDYSNADRLMPFTETHPAVMADRIKEANFTVPALSHQVNRMGMRRKFLQWIEDLTGIRLGEYKNYTLLK